jgi:hypothetical protein
VYLGWTFEESAMAELLSALEARAQLHRIIERLTDEEAVAIWRLVCSWVPEGITEQPAREESKEHP